MASDLLSLVDASALLGVSPERVRQLVVAGDLPGVRFGNAWAVPVDAVAARRQVSNRKGRPVSSRRAWEAIAAGDVDLSNVSRYRNRGVVHRYELSDADARHLAGLEGSLRSGVAAANEYGQGLLADPAGGDLYLSESVHADLHSMVAAVPDSLGSVVIRVVSDEQFGLLELVGVAPAAAVALDLMDSGDPRHWVAAENLIARRG